MMMIIIIIIILLNSLFKMTAVTPSPSPINSENQKSARVIELLYPSEVTEIRQQANTASGGPRRGKQSSVRVVNKCSRGPVLCHLS